jgi:molecular chaperone DnaK (HSP70)
MRCSQLKKRNEEVVIELKSDDKTKQFGIIELAKAVFKKLRETAVSGGCSPKISIPATLAAPSYFTSDQRQEIRLIAESAGFSILRIVSEPAAAALAYDTGQEGTENVRYLDL